MWPSQCGVPWETTKPPRKTLLPAEGNTPSRPQSPGTAGRGHSAGPAPAHGDTITLNSSCGRKRGDSPGQKKTPDIQETWWIQVSDFKLFLLSRQRWPESLQGKQEQEERGAVPPRASTACSSSCELGGSAGPRGHQSLDRLLTGSCCCVNFVLQTHTTACVVL